MLDIKIIRENPEMVKTAIESKNEKCNIEAIIENHEKRRKLVFEADELKKKRNENSALVARLKRENKDASQVVEETKAIGPKIKEIDQEIFRLDQLIREDHDRIPNLPHTDTPVGKNDADNVQVKEWGNKPSFSFQPKDHVALGELNDILDFPRGSKISGSGFPVYKRQGARLERALINFMLDRHIEKNGYTEIFPPFVANRDSMYGTGQLPKLEDDMYFMEKDDLFLIPTAEVPVTNLHRNETLREEELPVKYAAYSACFRREAGSYGKDTRGFQRVHQFNKIEMVNFVHPDNSEKDHEQMLNDATEILELLKLPYRVLLLCSGDLSFAAGKCYDIETWSAAENKWLEASSVSHFDSFQARRANIRFKPLDGGKARFLHTINGSGLATSRLIVSLMEHYQMENGTINIPEVLQPYMGGTKTIGTHGK